MKTLRLKDLLEAVSGPARQMATASRHHVIMKVYDKNTEAHLETIEETWSLKSHAETAIRVRSVALIKKYKQQGKDLTIIYMCQRMPCADCGANGVAPVFRALGELDEFVFLTSVRNTTLTTDVRIMASAFDLAGAGGGSGGSPDTAVFVMPRDGSGQETFDSWFARGASLAGSEVPAQLLLNAPEAHTKVGDKVAWAASLKEGELVPPPLRTMVQHALVEGPEAKAYNDNQVELTTLP
jgi:hypothetical protein